MKYTEYYLRSRWISSFSQSKRVLKLILIIFSQPFCNDVVQWMTNLVEVLDLKKQTTLGRKMWYSGRTNLFLECLIKRYLGYFPPCCSDTVCSIIAGDLKAKGVVRPLNREIYKPLLTRLRAEGINSHMTTTVLWDKNPTSKENK